MNMKFFLMTFIKGGGIGIANVIPGISGGTIAVIFGIYDKLIESLSNLLDLKKIHIKEILFLLTLVTGAISFIFISTDLIVYLLNNHFKVLMFCFMGVILGSSPRVIKMHTDMRIRFSRSIILTAGFLIPIILPWLANNFSFGNVFFSRNSYIVFIITGILTGGTMLIPGISGAMVMLLLGQYSIIVNYVNQFKVKPLVFFSSGLILGILIFAKLISIFLKKYPAVTLYFILGLIWGACFKLYPGLPPDLRFLFLYIMVFILSGIVSFIFGNIKFKSKGVNIL